MSWGKTLHLVAQALPQPWGNGVKVVQVNGAVSHSQSPGLASAAATMIANKGRGDVTLLPTPAILERAETKQAIESDRFIRSVLAHAGEADTYLFSAGPATEASIHVQSGYINRVSNFQSSAMVVSFAKGGRSRMGNVKERICRSYPAPHAAR